MAFVTVTIPNDRWFVQTTRVVWTPQTTDVIPLGTTLSVNGSTELFLQQLILPRNSTRGMLVELSEASGGFFLGPDFSDTMENQGRITLVASNGVSVTIGLEGEDSIEPYVWVPSNALEVHTFANALVGLTDRSLMATFDDLVNQLPVVTAQASTQTVNGNGVVTLTGTATDPDPVPDPLGLQWTANPNVGTFSDDDVLSPTWTAPAPTANDQQVVLTLTATEPDENLTGSASVTVTVRGNQRPSVTASADMTTVDASDTVNLTGTATDPEGQTLTYRWTSDNGGILNSPTSLNTTWVAPTLTDSAVVTLTLTATDPAGLTGVAATTVIVRAPTTQPLELPAVADQSNVSGVVVNVTLPVASEGLTPYIYSATGLPTGLRFRNRRVEGIPVIPGTYSVAYVVTDSNQDMVTRTFDWTITGDIIPQPSGINLRVDWGDQFYSHALSNVTARIVSGIQFERGKNTGAAILGRAQAGQLRCELQNSDGRYDQDNAASPLFGLIRPGIQVQLRNGVTPLWTGVLDSLPARLEQSGQHRSVLTAYGVLSNTLDADVSGGSLTAESTAQAFIELCGKADVPTESPQPQPGDAYVMRRWWLTGKLKDALNVIEDTEGGFIFEDREGELGFHLANYRPGRTVQRTFVSTTPVANQLRIARNPRTQLAVKDVHNEVRGEVRQFDTQTSQTLFTGVDPIPIGLGATLALVVAYPIATGAITELDTLVAGTDWTANTETDGSGTNRTVQVGVQIELMDFNEIHITATYPVMSGTQADTLYIRGLTVKGTVLTESTPLTVAVEDSVSKQRYRPKTRDLRGTWIRSVSDMTSRANALLTALAEPERRISLDWYVTDWAEFLALDLSERVGVSLPTVASDGFIEAVDCFIPIDNVLPVCTLDISLVASTATPPPPPPPPPPVGDSVTVPLTGLQEFTNYIRWPDNVSLGSTFAADGTEQTLNFVDLNNNSPAGRVSLAIVGFNRRFTTEFEATGLLTFEASDGETLEVMIADADMTETYAWTPTNSAEVVAFVAHVRGLTDQDVMLTLSE